MTEAEWVRQWLEVAGDDLDVAGRCLAYHPQKFAVACYHSQQCAEKALKAFLLSRKIDPPRTHELPLLCTTCMEQDAAFETVYDLCAKLTLYGVAMRYPLELPIDAGTAKTAVERAKQVYDFSRDRIAST